MLPEGVDCAHRAAHSKLQCCEAQPVLVLLWVHVQREKCDAAASGWKGGVPEPLASRACGRNQGGALRAYGLLYELAAL
jgi:hypothetical protein